MLKSSLLFLAIGILFLLVADIEITTLDPMTEMGRMGWGALTPDFSSLYQIRFDLLNTVVFAFCGIALGIAAGSVLAFFFQRRPVRLACAFVRAIHEIFWAFLLIPIVGLNSVCGVLAIAIPYAGIFAKVYAEILEEADQRPLHALPPGTNPVVKFCYGVVPVIFGHLSHYTSYRFECALRSSAVLGFIGLPTLGYHLETAFREGYYSEASALLYIFFVLIASLKYWVKPKWAMAYVLLAFVMLAKEVRFSFENVARFFHEILPWPMRRQGVLDGSGDLSLPWADIWDWFAQVIRLEAAPGIWNTIVLTQIVLAATGVFAVLAIPALCRHLSGGLIRRPSSYLFIVLRTTPEYIMAYIFLQAWGPSMLPAVAAIALHNGAILSHLIGNHASLLQLRIDITKKRINRYAYEILPRIYGSFLAFLFYRWEVMMRESAILGILGIYTLGFYIDSAISDDKLDKAVLLILFTALLNMGIDHISQKVRRALKVSTKLVSNAVTSPL